MRIRHEHDPVRSSQHQFAGGGILHLTRHGVELDPHVAAFELADLQRHKIEKQGAVAIGVDRYHLALDLLGEGPMDIVEIRRLATACGAVIDDFALNLTLF